MKAVIQRVSESSVKIENKPAQSIKKGLLIFLGVGQDDTQEDVEWLARKIVSLRIFGDDDNLMNLSVNDVDGEVMIISQFTLYAKTRKGSRPSFIKSANPDLAIPLYEDFIDQMHGLVRRSVRCGEFGAHMEVSLVNDGPVTIIIDTKNKE